MMSTSKHRPSMGLLHLQEGRKILSLRVMPLPRILLFSSSISDRQLGLA